MDNLPYDALQEILVRTDLPELATLRQVNRRLRAFISTEDFARVYNTRHQGTSWLMVQLFTTDSRSIGFLLCRKLSVNGGTYVMDLRRFFGWCVDRGQLSLVSASGCLVLFVFESQDKHMFLVVLNLFTAQVHFTQLPEPVDFRHEFKEWQDISFNIVPQSNAIMGFNIRNVVAVVNYNAEIEIPPRQRLYRFPEDIWVTSNPRQLEEGQNLIRYNSNDGMLVISRETAFMVSSQQGEVVYRSLPVNDMLQEALIRFKQNFVPLQDGWVGTDNVEHHGRHGWVVSTEYLVHPMYEIKKFYTACIGVINLFRIASDWSAYEYVSTFPGLPTLSLTYHCWPLIEQTGTIVNITYMFTTEGNPLSTANHAEWGLDQTEFGLVVFSYNITNPGWTFEVFPLKGIEGVHNPVFTPTLTIGRFPDVRHPRRD